MTAPRVTPASARAKNLTVAVREAVGQMAWLKESDQALVETVVRLAQQLEDTVAIHYLVVREMKKVLKDPSVSPEDKIAAADKITTADARIEKAVGWIAPQVINGLKALGGDPVTAKDLAGGGAVGGRLNQLRQGRHLGVAG